MFCDVRQPDGEPFGGDSRAALRRVLEQAAGLGYTMQVGCEVEFFIFAALGANGAVPDDARRRRLLRPHAAGRRQRLPPPHDRLPRADGHPGQGVAPRGRAVASTRSSSRTPTRCRWPTRSRPSGSPSRRSPTSSAPTRRSCPSRSRTTPAAGMHLHISLFEGDRNAFHDADPDKPLSPTGRAFLAGVLAHAGELTGADEPVDQLLPAPGDRLRGARVRQLDAPRRARRSCACRRAGPTAPRAARFELRSPDPACNPYLVLALVLAAGLRGIERGYELQPRSDRRRAAGAPRLPLDLREATDLFDASELARETLGDRLVDVFVANKRRELDDERRTVTEFDRSRYLRAPVTPATPGSTARRELARRPRGCSPSSASARTAWRPTGRCARPTATARAPALRARARDRPRAAVVRRAVRAPGAPTRTSARCR